MATFLRRSLVRADEGEACLVPTINAGARRLFGPQNEAAMGAYPTIARPVMVKSLTRVCNPARAGIPRPCAFPSCEFPRRDRSLAMAEEKPSLHIDTDWKKQAQEEKKKLAEQEAQRKAAAPVGPAGVVPTSATVPAAAGSAGGRAPAQQGARGRRDAQELPEAS